MKKKKHKKCYYVFFIENTSRCTWEKYPNVKFAMHETYGTIMPCYFNKTSNKQTLLKLAKNGINDTCYELYQCEEHIKLKVRLPKKSI